MDKTREFMDIRNHGFMRVAVAVPRIHLADPVQNVDEHIRMLETLYDDGAQYVLFPELGLTGYTNGDLFHNEQLLTSAREELERLIRMTHRMASLIFTVGLPLRIDDALHNCAVTVKNGHIIAIASKAYLPNEREFYEVRHYARADELLRNTVTIGRWKDIPIGRDIIIRSRKNEHFALHVEICEDLWVPISPSSKAALAGATVLANLSASNITIGKSEYRQQLVLTSSAKNNAIQMYSAAGFGESTTDLAWDGDGYIAERGSLLCRTERFKFSGTSIITDVNLALMRSERMRQTSFRQNAADNRTEFREVYCDDHEHTESESDERRSRYFSFRRTFDPHPFVPKDPAKRDERCYETFMIQATALAKRLAPMIDPQDGNPPFKNPTRKVAIGVSGGRDSTHALVVAAYAMDLLGYPRTNIIAVTMPGFGTTDRTYNNAVRLSKALGTDFREIDIKPIVQQAFKDVAYDPERDGLTLLFENAQARERLGTLLDICWKEGNTLVLGTGDLSELLLGYCTYLGDHSSHYGINAGVPKTLISFLISWAADVIFKNEPIVQEVLRDIITMVVSAELLPPDKEGNIVQRTEKEIGPYELHDFSGHAFVRFGMRPFTISRLALAAYQDTYSIGDIKHWLGVFLIRFFASQFKRSFLPDSPKVGLTSVSPRGDWRMSSDALVNAWMADLENKVPDELIFSEIEMKPGNIIKNVK